ncbi:hypothetical protein H4696_000255 [Amycolatopsis lexingtonensis]|uniref:Uncharacterized protein n=1 Tax=Amycolatopsis lexingtonensis TaxID=218822 RepID=A0ABR9HQG3_9PSEU|nr:hypothetical protein [Amycolatopsis lexingtonensis]MBE1493155.1 hypothetical protein [Amycolatopsis lexingtonensis]
MDDALQFLAEARRRLNHEVGVARATGGAPEPGQPMAVDPEEQLFGDDLARVGTSAGVFGVDVDGNEGLAERADDGSRGAVGVEDGGCGVEAVGDRVRAVVGVDDDERRSEECLVEARR